MNEADFQRRVTDMAVRFGWKWWHVPAPMRAVHDEQTGARKWIGAKEGAGVADLILTHHDPPRLVFMELKGDGGKLSDRQTEFLAAVKVVADETKQGFDGWGEPTDEYDATVGVYAFWPKDEPAIEQLLRSRVLT